MFAMLAGDLPAPPRQASAQVPDPLADLDALLALQTEAGLGVVSDAGLFRDLDPVARWRRTSERTDRLVCGIVLGPWTLAATERAGGPSSAGASSAAGRPASRAGRRVLGARIPDAVALEAAAEATRATIEGLVAAGCQLIRVDEPGLTTIEGDEEVRSMVRAAHDRALPELGDAHAMLALTGGDATGIGAPALAGMRYASFLFDLLRGPDSWRVVAQLPAERGVVCGVVPTGPDPDVVKETMVWAAHYAASTAGRGLDRVGLASAGDLGGLAWEVAAERIRVLGQAARIAASDSLERLALELDPRAIGRKSGAFGPNRPVPGEHGRRRTAQASIAAEEPGTAEPRPGDPEPGEPDAASDRPPT